LARAFLWYELTEHMLNVFERRVLRRKFGPIQEREGAGALNRIANFTVFTET
jgi:hypothetical protein